MSVGSIDGLGMKNAWNRNVRMMSARTNAMRMSPGTSPRNPRKPCRVFFVARLRFLERGALCRLHRSRVPVGVRRWSVPVRFRVSRQDERDLDRLERGPHGSAFAEPEAVDRAERDLGDDRRRAGQADPGALALDRDLGDRGPAARCAPIPRARRCGAPRPTGGARRARRRRGSRGRSSGHGTTTLPSRRHDRSRCRRRAARAGRRTGSRRPGRRRRACAGRCGAARPCPTASLSLLQHDDAIGERHAPRPDRA